MKRTVINPWTWQDNLGFSQAIEIKNNEAILYCAGACAIDETGKAVNADIHQQVHIALDNLKEMLKQSGYNFSDIVRLNYYTTSIGEFFSCYQSVVDRLKAEGCIPTSTLLEISALAQPELKIEIEATAAK